MLDRVVKLESEKKRLQGRVEKIELEMRMLKNELKEDVIEQLKKEMQEELDERADRERRKTNILIFNVKEQEGEDTEESKGKDEAEVERFFDKGVELKDLKVMEISRMGRKREVNERPRPILVSFQEDKEKWKVLGKLSKLKGKEEFKDVRVKRDMTKKERETEKALREELKEKREKEEGTWIIKQGKVIRVGVPTAQQGI